MTHPDHLSTPTQAHPATASGSEAPAPGASLTRRGLLACGLASLLTPAAAWADLAALKERGTLKIALYTQHLPFSEANASGMRGLDARLGQALAKELGLAVQWLPFDAGENMGDDLRNMVWKGHYLGYGPADVMLQVPIDRHLIDDTPQVEFLAPYYRHQLGWLVGPDIRSDDLQRMALDGVTLTAETGTAAASALLGHGAGRFKTAVHLEASGVDAARLVVNGQRQAAYVTRAQAESALFGASAAGTMRFETAALPGTPHNGWVVGMAIKKGQPELAKAVGQALHTLRDNGTLQAIYREQGLQLVTP